MQGPARQSSEARLRLLFVPAPAARSPPHDPKRAKSALVSAPRNHPLHRQPPRAFVPGDLLDSLEQLEQLALAEMLDADELVASMPNGADQLVELALDRGGIAVLGVL